MTRQLRRILAVSLCIIPTLSCSDPLGVDKLGDFMILAPGDYFFVSPLTIRPSTASADSVIFRWEESRGADRYSIVFSQAQSLTDLTNYIADISAPLLTIPITNARTVLVDYGIPNPLLDTVPVAQYPALQHVVYLRDLDALLATQPRGVPLYFVWSMLAHEGSKTARSIEVHRLIVIRA